MLLAPLFAALLSIQVPEPPAGPAIRWDAPSGCPDRGALERAIAGRLGRVPGPAELELDGKIVRGGQHRLDLRLSVDGHTQARTLHARSCAALVDAAALLAALAVDPAATALAGAAPGDVDSALDALVADPDDPGGDPLAAAEAPELPAQADLPVDADDASTDPSPPASPPDAAPAALVESPLAPPPAPPRGPGGFLRLAGGLEVGAVPDLTAGFALAGGLLWKRARLELHGVYLAPQTAARGDSAVRVDLFAAAVHGCGRLRRGRFEFPLCGGLELGGLRADARGPGARSATALWGAGLLSAAAVWRFHPRLGLSLTAQGLARFAAASLELRGPGPAVTLFEPAPVSFRLLLGLEIRFGDPS